MNEREMVARAIGYLEGIGVWMWAQAGEKIDDESVAFYDRQVEELRQALFKETGVAE